MSLLRHLILAITIFAALGCSGSGSTGITLPSGSPKWTVMVFMNAANDLYPEGDLNVVQMQKAASNPAVHIVVQWKQSQRVYPQSSFNGTRRYEITGSQSSTLRSKLVQDLGTSVDMGTPKALQDFVTWAKANYPAERYALVLWDHGNGWRTKRAAIPKGRAFSYDTESQHAIQIWEVPQALSGQHVDMLVWDCSLMQMAEVAYQFRSTADYVVGSEESPPAQGFPYNTALAPFRDNPSATTLTLTKGWVDSMANAPGYANRNIEESVIDTSKLPNLCSAVDAFALALTTNKDAVASATQSIRAMGQQYDTNIAPPRFFFDAEDMCDRYIAAGTPLAVQNGALGVKAAIGAAVVYERHNAHSSGSHGISIDFSPAASFTPYQGEYSLMDFGKVNRWSQWLSVAP